MRRWTLSTLVQVMARRLFATKPLPKPMLIYCQLDRQEQVKFKSKYKIFIRENAFKDVVCERRPFCSWGDELNHFFCSSLALDIRVYLPYVLLSQHPCTIVQRYRLDQDHVSHLSQSHKQSFGSKCIDWACDNLQQDIHLLSAISLLMISVDFP